jgi:hypothetical protein
MKRHLAIAIALVGFGAIASADVFTQLNGVADQGSSPTFDIIDWGDNAGGNTAPFYTLTSPLSYSSFSGNTTGFVTNTSGGDLAYLQQSYAGWNGNFDPGANLLWDENNQNNPPDGVTVTFSAPVNSVGFQIQADFFGSFTGQLEVFGSSGLLGTLILDGSSNGNADDSALFMGLLDDSGANITSIDIQTYNSFDINDFAIDDISITSDASTSVPEPGSIVLLASVVLGVAGLLRRRLSGESA